MEDTPGVSEAEMSRFSFGHIQFLDGRTWKGKNQKVKNNRERCNENITRSWIIVMTIMSVIICYNCKDSLLTVNRRYERKTDWRYNGVREYQKEQNYRDYKTKRSALSQSSKI